MKNSLHVEIGVLIRASTKKMLLFLGIMTIHSFAEGINLVVSFANTMELGILIAIAIAVHKIPEGLAISLVMIPKGTSPIKDAWWVSLAIMGMAGFQILIAH